MRIGFLDQVRSIYAAEQSPNWVGKFCDDHSTVQYSVVQLPFGGRWVGAAAAAEYLRRRAAALEVGETSCEVENYDEARGTFTVRTSYRGRWRRTGRPAAFAERHFGELAEGRIGRLVVIALDPDEMLDGYFTRAEQLFNTLMKSLLRHGVGEPTLELIADDFVYTRPATRRDAREDDIIHAAERRGREGFAQFFADLFGSVDLRFGAHRLLYGDQREAVVHFPFTRFVLRATGADVTGEDVACYDSFVFDSEGKLRAWSPHLSRTFAHSEFYGAAADT